MTTTIGNVLSKPSDYWVCPDCNSLNWYEEDECCDKLGMGCVEGNPLNTQELLIKDFNTLEEYDIAYEQKEEEYKELRKDMDGKIKKWISDEIEFYMEEYNYEKEDCYNVELYL